MENQNTKQQNTISNEKLDEILEVVLFLKDGAVHKEDFDKHVKNMDVQIKEIKNDVACLKKDMVGVKEDVADLKEDTSNIRNHVKCLRFAVEKSVEILSEKKVYNDKEKQTIMEQLMAATI